MGEEAPPTSENSPFRKKLRTSPEGSVVLTGQAPLDHNENDKNNLKLAATAADDKAARDKTVCLLDLMPQSYPPRLVGLALESVGYPYGVQDVMHEISKCLAQAQLEECFNKREEEKEPFKVTKDMQILEAYKGDLWEGRVIHEKPKLVYRNGKMVNVWEVEYEDDSV